MKTYNEMANNALLRIEEYNKMKNKRRKKLIKTFTPIACCFLIAIIGIGLWQGGLFASPPIAQSDSPSDKQGEGYTQDKGEEKQYTMYTSPIKLRESASGTTADMLGYIVYKGKAYLAADFYDEEKLIDSLVGDYIGEARVTFDKGSKRMDNPIDYTTELASSTPGPVYTVNGYSEDFRLCKDVGDSDIKRLVIYENFDAIGLSTGSDLFEERLHLTNNIINVTYKTHSDWFNETGKSKELEGVSLEQFNSFISELCSSPFEHLDTPDFYKDLYDKKVQGCLYIHMKDGTQVGLYLIDGGYVGYQHLIGCYVKMDSSMFYTILNACQ